MAEEFTFNPFTANFDAVQNIDGALIFQGTISIASDFPTTADVKNGWVYFTTADVTDDDPTKTNTGQDFQSKDEIAWNGTNWAVMGNTKDVDYISFDTTYTPTGSEPTGTSYYDSENKTMSTVLENGVIGQWFEEDFHAGQNDTGDTLLNGTVATYAGSIGNSGQIRIANTIASAGENPILTIGIITADISDGARGKITTRGNVRGIQTDGANYSETWTEGEILYKSSTIAGGLTNVPPEAPIPAIPLAVVISAHATNGTLFIRPTFPQSLTMLTDVNGTPLTTSGQLLEWNQTEGYFDFTANINDYARLDGTNQPFTGDLSTNENIILVAGKKVYLDSNSYFTKNGTMLELWVNGELNADWGTPNSASGAPIGLLLSLTYN